MSSSRGPFLDNEPRTSIQPSDVKRQVGKDTKIELDHPPDGILASRHLAGRMAFEDRIKRVPRDNRLQVLPVPRVIIGLDNGSQRLIFGWVRHSHGNANMGTIGRHQAGRAII